MINFLLHNLTVLIIVSENGSSMEMESIDKKSHNTDNNNDA